MPTIPYFTIIYPEQLQTLHKIRQDKSPRVVPPLPEISLQWERSQNCWIPKLNMEMWARWTMKYLGLVIREVPWCLKWVSGCLFLYLWASCFAKCRWTVRSAAYFSAGIFHNSNFQEIAGSWAQEEKHHNCCGCISIWHAWPCYSYSTLQR